MLVSKIKEPKRVHSILQVKPERSNEEKSKKQEGYVNPNHNMGDEILVGICHICETLKKCSSHLIIARIGPS